jgi:putative glutamine amidotransferase
MEKALIGVTPLYDENRGVIWMLPEYGKGVSLGGGLPVILPLTESAEEARALARRLDGFLFTGGQDVSPALYDQTELPFCGKTSARRDAFEKALLEEVLRLNKPFLGICRGLQFLNVMLGGSLYQDIPSQTAAAEPLIHSQEKPYDVPVHDLFLPDGPVRRLAGVETIRVNSLHHQAVARLADGLRPAALAPDGILEAAYMPSQRFMLGVQWHPEFMPDSEVSAALFRALVDACA